MKVINLGGKVKKLPSEQYLQNYRTLRTCFHWKAFPIQTTILVLLSPSPRASDTHLWSASNSAKEAARRGSACCSWFWCSRWFWKCRESAIDRAVPFHKGKSWGLNSQDGIVNHARVGTGSGGDNSHEWCFESSSAIPFKIESKWCLRRARNGSCRV